MVSSASADTKESSTRPSRELVPVNPTPAPSQAKSEPPTLLFLLFLLFLNCLNLLANNMLSNGMKANAIFWVPHIHVTQSETETIVSLARNLNLVSIILGVFTGIITDILSAPIALVLFSIIGASGLLLFFLNTQFGATAIFYEISIVIYGGAQNQSRIPMQKMASVLFEGPYLATAMNVNHTFAHVSSVLSTAVTPVLSNTIGIIPTIAFLCFIGWFCIPICMVLYGLYTQKISVKGEGSREPLATMLKGYFLGTEYLAWVVLAMGFVLDGITVGLKNAESGVFKSLNFDREGTNTISTVSKLVLFGTPLYSYLIDKFTYRQYFFVICAAMQTGVLFTLYCLTVGNDIRISVFMMILIQMIYKLVTAIFLAAFYSYYAVTIPKKIRGVAFGFNNSVLSISYFFMTGIFAGKQEVNIKMRTMVIFGLVGTGISVVVFVLNMRLGDILNKDRLAREKGKI